MLACAVAIFNIVVSDQVRYKASRYQSNAIKHRVSACALAKPQMGGGGYDQVRHKIHVCYRENEKQTRRLACTAATCVFVISDQVRNKPDCKAKVDGYIVEV